MVSPLDYVARLCKARLSKGGDDNYHIFLNSVDGILRIIRLAGLSPDDCRIVCSQSGDSMVKNEKKLGSYRIQKTTDPVKMFNFYTSTCFEGQDIYDEDGRTFIVSEPYKNHTKMDVTTTLPQICGRIRNSKYSNEINQIYANSQYRDVTPDEFKEKIRLKVENAEHDAECLNRMTQDGKALLKDYINKYPYVDVIDGRIVVDRNMANLEMVNYDIVNGQYSMHCNMVEALESTGMDVRSISGICSGEEELEDPKTIQRLPFKDIFEEYVTIRQNRFDLRLFRKSRIEAEKPLVKDAYEILGADEVRRLNYHQHNIKQEIIKRSHETASTKVFLLLDKKLPKGAPVPRSTIKEDLAEIYRELGLKRAAKATDIKE